MTHPPRVRSTAYIEKDISSESQLVVKKFLKLDSTDNNARPKSLDDFAPGVGSKGWYDNDQEGSTISRMTVGTGMVH